MSLLPMRCLFCKHPTEAFGDYTRRCHSCDATWTVGYDGVVGQRVAPLTEPTLTLPKSRIEAALREAWDDGWMHGDLSADRSDLKRDAYIRTTLAELEQP